MVGQGSRWHRAVWDEYANMGRPHPILPGPLVVATEGCNSCCLGVVDPFDPASPIKQLEISHFPPDMFFVLRTVQLLRGLATGMGVQEFSAATQWCLSTLLCRLRLQRVTPVHVPRWNGCDVNTLNYFMNNEYLVNNVLTSHSSQVKI